VGASLTECPVCRRGHMVVRELISPEGRRPHCDTS
jgi:hypothetical protein